MKNLTHLKRPLRPLIALILSNPEVSNARIARIGRCDARRVSRYRRAIEAHAYTKDQLLGCDEATLQALLKRPQPKRVEARPDFETLDVELPNASALVQWQHYRAGALSECHRVLSYSGFNRARRAHRRLARIVESHGLHPRLVERPNGPALNSGHWSVMRLVGEVAACIRATPFDVVGAPLA
jgi:hypothetical protein